MSRDEEQLAPHVEVADRYDGPPPREEQGLRDFYAPIVLIIVAVIALVSVVPLGLGTLASFEPGLWPTILAVSIIVGSIVSLIQHHSFHVPERAGLVRTAIMTLSLLAFVFLYDWAGFVGAGVVCMFVIGRWVAKLSWLKAAILAVLSVGIVYVMFGPLLGVNLRMF
ncbi:tripartite tricarboxylate transporter TctB family protein [Micrococcoides hystricis]|uniref:Tripartite tricarboxylate transporter TctB family protein n=1 Tax=Micrococcoides hystricis TaxID=1572761 RepID=A0ABV6PBF2_9MICC